MLPWEYCSGNKLQSGSDTIGRVCISMVMKRFLRPIATVALASVVLGSLAEGAGAYKGVLNSTHGQIAAAPVRPPVSRRSERRSRPSPADDLPPLEVPEARPQPDPTPQQPINRPGMAPQFQYRLVVSGSSDTLLRQVRQVVPDAFRNTIGGNRVIQAGLFVEREEAEAVQRQLERRNLNARILDINEGVVAVPVPPVVRSPASSSSGSLPRIPSGRVVVVVDPGHGGRDPGAVGIGGIQEADIVLDIARQVAAKLDQQGVTAVLTREDDRDVDLAPRVSLAERVNADLFVSIHANAISMARSDVNGLETYYYLDGQRLAQTIHDQILSTIDMNDRGVRQARFYVLTRTSMPAVLVEVGFVTGQQDAARLSNPAFREQLAGAIAQGILQYIQRYRS